MRKTLSSLFFLVCLLYLVQPAFAQPSAEQEFVSWSVSSGLSNGQLVMQPNDWRTLVVTLTVRRQLNPNAPLGTYYPVNFQFRLARQPSGTTSTVAASALQTVADADFGNTYIITKQYSIDVTSGTGTSNTGQTLRNGDRLKLEITSPNTYVPTPTYPVAIGFAINNNTITNTGSTSFSGSGDPSLLSGSTPTGGSAPTYTYQWQSSTTSTTAGFADISGANAVNYDPPTISHTTYYRRVVTSGGFDGTSNVITITVARIGATINNPIELGNLNMCGSYGEYRDIYPGDGYGNEIGNQYDDVFYRFNQTVPGRLRLSNCKPDGVSTGAFLLNASGTILSGTASPDDYCDVGSIIEYNLPAGIYYVVIEPGESYQNFALFNIYLNPQATVSPNTTIAAGTSTTLTATGVGAYTYTWSPATGLSSTTGASVIASPAVTTTYTVSAVSGGCNVYKSVTVYVTGSTGSTISNPIVVSSIGGCGYTAPSLYSAGYGNEFGSPGDDIYYQFTVGSATQVRLTPNTALAARVAVLNSAGTVVAQEFFDWVDSGDDAGTYYYLPLDGTPFTPTLQPGTYYAVVDLTAANAVGNVSVTIETPAGYSCRKAAPEQFRQNVPATEESEITRIVYPNPARENITIRLAEKTSVNVQFINLHGATVKETTLRTPGEVSVADLPGGLYLVKVLQGSTVHHEKVLIEK